MLNESQQKPKSRRQHSTHKKEDETNDAQVVSGDVNEVQTVPYLAVCSIGSTVSWRYARDTVPYSSGMQYRQYRIWRYAVQIVPYDTQDR